MRFLIVMLLLPVISMTGSVYDDTDVLSVDTFNFNCDTSVITDLASTGDFLWWDSSPMGDSILRWPLPKRDTTDHYVSGIDSTWIIDRVECDTMLCYAIEER